MVLRLTLICQAPTAATRRATFPDDEPLDGPGLARARARSFKLVTGARCVRSPAIAAEQTAEALGLSAEVVTELRDCDYGAWAGRSLDDVQAHDPEGVARWLADPESKPHGGESLFELIGRMSAWLDSQTSTGHLAAITHGSLIKAAVVTALQAPASAFWRIDAPPLSVARLSRRGKLWTLQAFKP